MNKDNINLQKNVSFNNQIRCFFIDFWVLKMMLQVKFH